MYSPGPSRSPSSTTADTSREQVVQVTASGTTCAGSWAPRGAATAPSRRHAPVPSAESRMVAFANGPGMATSLIEACRLEKRSRRFQQVFRLTSGPHNCKGGRNPLGETGCGPAYCRRSFNGVTMQSRLPRESGRSEYTNRSSPGVLTNLTSSSNSRRAISSPATGSSTSTVVCRNRFRSIYVFNGTSARTPPLTPARGVKDVGARRTATQSSPFASWWMPPMLGFEGAWNGAPTFMVEYGRNHSESRSMRVFSSPSRP